MIPAPGVSMFMYIDFSAYRMLHKFLLFAHQSVTILIIIIPFAHFTQSSKGYCLLLLTHYDIILILKHTSSYLINLPFHRSQVYPKNKLLLVFNSFVNPLPNVKVLMCVCIDYFSSFFNVLN